MRGYHLKKGAPGGDEWMVAGQWAMELAESGGNWHTTAITLRTLYRTGNERLLSGSNG